jgi:muramoyltetrapeptide carboxypeptidase
MPHAGLPGVPTLAWWETTVLIVEHAGEGQGMKIAVVAPSCTLKREAAARVQALVAARGDCELAIHPQCFLSDGHFAGPDEARLAALREVMADASVDAVWFARGGYGSNRIAEAALADCPAGALGKLYMGYSDAGFLLAGFHKAGLEVAHGPMPQDVMRDGGDAAIVRALDWMVGRDRSALEPAIHPPAMAFNLTVLSNLLGTPLEPDFTAVDLMVEEVSEHLYRIDRTMFHVASSSNVRKVARLRLGRVSDVLPNDSDFGADESAIVEDWCARSGIAFGGRAEIGHDAFNRVVPFPLREN